MLRESLSLVIPDHISHQRDFERSALIESQGKEMVAKPLPTDRHTNGRSIWFDQPGHALATKLVGSETEHVVSPATLMRVMESVNAALPRVTPSFASEFVARPSQKPFSEEGLALVEYGPKPSNASSDHFVSPCMRAAALETLFSLHSSVLHMGLTDVSFGVFINKNNDAALCFKIEKGVAVICGDPMCEPKFFDRTLQEFRHRYRHIARHVAFLGVSESFASYAKKMSWVTVQFGVERIINPLSNPLLAGNEGKRIYIRSMQLLHPENVGLKLDIYDPSHSRDPPLEAAMAHAYESWRTARQDSQKVRTFLTIFSVSSTPSGMMYLYIRGSDGALHGFAGLRKLGVERGYHLDPCIETPWASKGNSDLLIIAAMALLKYLGVSYLSLGYKPSNNIGEITGMPRLIIWAARSLYHHLFQTLFIDGKMKFQNCFRPDDNQKSSLCLVFYDKESRAASGGCYSTSDTSRYRAHSGQAFYRFQTAATSRDAYKKGSSGMEGDIENLINESLYLYDVEIKYISQQFISLNLFSRL